LNKGSWKRIFEEVFSLFTTFHHLNVLTILVFLKLILSPLVGRCRTLIHNKAQKWMSIDAPPSSLINSTTNPR